MGWFDKRLQRDKVTNRSQSLKLAGGRSWRGALGGIGTNDGRLTPWPQFPLFQRRGLADRPRRQCRLASRDYEPRLCHSPPKNGNRLVDSVTLNGWPRAAGTMYTGLAYRTPCTLLLLGWRVTPHVSPCSITTSTFVPRYLTSPLLKLNDPFAELVVQDTGSPHISCLRSRSRWRHQVHD